MRKAKHYGLCKGGLGQEDTAALFDAFSIVGEDISEANVDYAHDAEREVVLKGE